MIEQLRDKMQSVSEYKPEELQSYVWKNPVVVDGNSFHAFEENKLLAEAKRIKTTQDYSGDELFVFAGTPRLMSSYKEFTVTPESRQNFLVLCDSNESSCGTAVVTSVMKSFEMQNRDVKIWSYERNRIYRSARKDVWNERHIIADLEDICEEIRNIKNEIQSGEELSSRLIVLLGFENICADFELLDENQNKKIKTNEAATEAVEKMESVMVDI